ncbi:hypothetical protein QBC44DRAFT_362907 [Cladorrhinum sp. PSN332]|nr:hypothetical protein QBC44DRAFT_362907 [Cladorrhinum sp. PSN332]
MNFSGNDDDSRSTEYFNKQYAEIMQAFTREYHMEDSSYSSSYSYGPEDDPLSNPEYLLLCALFTLLLLFVSFDRDLFHIFRFWLAYPFRSAPLIGPTLRQQVPAALTNSTTAPSIWPCSDQEESSLVSKTCRYFTSEPERTSRVVGTAFWGFILGMWVMSYCSRDLALVVMGLVWFVGCWYVYFLVMMYGSMGLRRYGPVVLGTVVWFVKEVVEGLLGWLGGVKVFWISVLVLVLYSGHIFDGDNWVWFFDRVGMVVAEVFYGLGDLVMDLVRPRCPSLGKPCKVGW